MSQEDIFEQNAEFSPANENPAIRAKIIGVGGAGLSLVDGLRLDNFKGVEHLVIDVDARALADSIADRKLPIGRTLTRGMGTGENFPLPAKRWNRKRPPWPNNSTGLIWSSYSPDSVEAPGSHTGSCPNCPRCGCPRFCLLSDALQLGKRTPCTGRGGHGRTAQACQCRHPSAQ